MVAYHLAEARLEVIDADVVLDGLELGDEGHLRLDQSSKLLLGDACELAERAEVLLYDGDLGLDVDVLLNDERGTFLRPALVPQAPLRRCEVTINGRRNWYLLATCI